MSVSVHDSHAIGMVETGGNHETTDELHGPTLKPIPVRWLLHDSPFIAMLLLALAGLVFRLPVTYWVILIPIFGFISIVAGWPHFKTRQERVTLVYSLALHWCALMLAIYLLYNSGVQGVLNANASSLAMMILLALGTFVSGIQAKVWRICAVGAALFLAVPGLGWLDQSPLLLTGATLVIIILGGFVWWIAQGPEDSVKPLQGATG
jgi:hypothetical protein